MTDEAAFNRVKEAERVILQAIEDVPLTCDAREASAAIQSVGLRLAERSMAPADIARTLLAQAEAYMRAAGAVSPPPLTRTDAEGVTEGAHRVLTTAVASLRQFDLAEETIRELMLGYVLAWIGRADAHSSAALLYRHADALAGKAASTH